MHCRVSLKTFETLAFPTPNVNAKSSGVIRAANRGPILSSSAGDREKGQTARSQEQGSLSRVSLLRLKKVGGITVWPWNSSGLMP